MKNMKSLPKFKNLAEEQKFWEEHDSADYVDWRKAKLAKLPNLKPSTRVISLRLPESLLIDIKHMANKNDVPYQSLIKLLLAEKMREERRH